MADAGYMSPQFKELLRRYYGCEEQVPKPQMHDALDASNDMGHPNAIWQRLVRRYGSKHQEPTSG